ncbi:MAG: FGGY-family carbohydrate kinase [Candidatus Hermodarchaeota archaeon]
MNKNKYILAIDHGTSGVKTAIVSTHGDVVDWIFEEVPLHLFKGGGAEQDPNDWWNAIKNTSQKLIDKGNVSVENIVGVCNTSQWSGTVAVDKDGNHLMNSIIWMDTRGVPYIKELHKGLIKISGYNLMKILKWVRITGGGPTLSGKDPIAHILWIKHQHPDIYDRTYMFLEPQDYVNLKLTGKFAASYASIQMHFLTDIRDINNIKYYNRLMKVCKVDPAKFPTELKWSTDVLGSITKEIAEVIGLNKDTKVVMGAPDLHSATIGSGAVRNYEGHIYIGTSDWLLCHVPHKKTDIFHNMSTFPAAYSGKYMLTNEQEIAGGALSFLKNNILYHKDELLKEETVPDVYKIFDKLVENTPAGANNLIFTPWLYGERSPVDDHSVRGGLYNISLDVTREHLIRAIFEGVAYNVKWLLYYVENFIKKWVKKEKPEQIQGNKIIPELNIIGGGASSNVWCQIFADVLDRKIKQVKNPIQANARGAAFMASVGLGYIEWEQIPKYIQFSNVFTPNPENRKIYDKLFEEYVNIYKNNKTMYQRLNRSR